LTHPTTPGGRQFSQAFTVAADLGDKQFSAPHTNAGLTRCGSCHQYAATTATTNIWAFKHRPSNPGITSTDSSPGCSMCH
jgi:cytochrome c553